MSSALSKPHPKNVPGDFYVEEDCCITCGVPLQEAPEIFAWTEGPEYTSCIVARQPRSRDEVDQVIAAMWAGEADCIRYRGPDPDIMRRIVELGHADLCDQAPPADAVALVRSHATFAMLGEYPSTASQLAADFRADFERLNIDRHRATPVQGDAEHASLEISWFDEVFHRVEFERLAGGRWLVVTKPHKASLGRSISLFVESWLKEKPCFQDFRWFSEEQWRSGGPYRSTVI